jgi:uroporphyrinogen-III synthase
MPLSGLCIVSFESRRVDEMKQLIAATGAEPVVVPSVHEVLLEPGPDLMELAQKLRAREIDAVLFSSAGGARGLFEVAKPVLSEEVLRTELSRITLAARGPKTLAALRALGFTNAIGSEPPHTSRELVRALEKVGIAGRELAVIESGTAQLELETELGSAGAHVLSVSVYRYALPEDTSELSRAIDLVVNGRAPIVLFTNARQVDNVFAVANGALEEALDRCVVGAVGEITARRLSSHGVEPDVVPSESRMDALVSAIAERAPALMEGRQR